MTANSAAVAGHAEQAERAADRADVQTARSTEHAERAERAAAHADVRARDADRISRWAVTIMLGIAFFVIVQGFTLYFTITGELRAVRTEIAALRAAVENPAP